jgi:hypothetical protein
MQLYMGLHMSTHVSYLEGGAGAEVRRLVEENSAGYVAAVYEKAAYVKTRDDDLVMFTSEPATPYCVYLGRWWDLLKDALRTGLEIRFKNMEVSVGGSFSVKLVDLGYPAPLTPSKPPAEMVRKALSLLTLIDTGVLSWRECAEGTAALRASKPADILDSLIPLIGSGPGATPAADDFTAGVLLAFHVAEFDVDAKPLIDHAKRFSRWPSWKMLEHAGHGCSFIQLNRVHEALCSRDVNKLYESILESMRIGSSSGICILKGFLETLLSLT